MSTLIYFLNPSLLLHLRLTFVSQGAKTEFWKSCCLRVGVNLPYLCLSVDEGKLRRLETTIGSRIFFSFFLSSPYHVTFFWKIINCFLWWLQHRITSLADLAVFASDCCAAKFCSLYAATADVPSYCSSYLHLSNQLLLARTSLVYMNGHVMRVGTEEGYFKTDGNVVLNQHFKLKHINVDFFPL